jgi:hypothetical protein
VGPDPQAYSLAQPADHVVGAAPAAAAGERRSSAGARGAAAQAGSSSSPPSSAAHAGRSASACSTARMCRHCGREGWIQPGQVQPSPRRPAADRPMAGPLRASEAPLLQSFAGRPGQLTGKALSSRSALPTELATPVAELGGPGGGVASDCRRGAFSVARDRDERFGLAL